MRIEFKTDQSIMAKGFRIKYGRHQCGGQISTETEISSPLHPDRYFHNTNCTWTVTAPRGKSVEIK